MRSEDLRAARITAFAVTGVLVLAMGLYAAVFSGPSQAAGSDDQATSAGCAPAAKPHPVWHGTKSLSLTPDNPIPREWVRLRGKVAKPVAPGASVRVQVKRPGKSWQTVDKDTSVTHNGRWTARFRAPNKKIPLSARAQVLDSRSRVVSTSKSQRLRVTELRIKLTVPDSVSVLEPWEASIAISPVRPGARVTLLMRLTSDSGAKVSSRNPFDDWLPIGTNFQVPPVPPAIFGLLPFSMGELSVQYPGPFGAANMPSGAEFGVETYGYAGIPPFEGDIGTPEDFGLNGTIPEEPTPTPTETPTPTDDSTKDPTDNPTPTDMPMRAPGGCAG